MNRSKFALWLACLAVALSLGLGCSAKKEVVASGTDSEVVVAAQALPEGTNVLAALEQKDYEAAVSGLAKIQQAVSGTEQETQLFAVKRHVRTTLSEAASSDPKAAEALSALRLLTQGR